MARIYDRCYFGDGVRPISEGALSIASSAVLYGLSIYTVFPVHLVDGSWVAFRLRDHFERLIRSGRVIGIDTFETQWDEQRFEQAVRQVLSANDPETDVFARVSVHVSELLPGTRSRGLATTVSIFLYEASPILPQDGARLKTSVWRRNPDQCIPSRAKVNGAYVNSVLARQDAIDSGYDDSILLGMDGHVAELSAANLFLVRNGQLITPPVAGEILEGINRRTVLELAAERNISAVERPVDLTELYIADEVFAVGTSAYIAPVKEIDARTIGDGTPGPMTRMLQELYPRILRGQEEAFAHLTTRIEPMPQ